MSPKDLPQVVGPLHHMHYPPPPVLSPVIHQLLYSNVRSKDNPSLAEKWKMSTTSVPCRVVQQPIYTDCGQRIIHC